MIEASLPTSHFTVGRATRLAVEFVNVGPGPCSDIGLRLELPPGFSLLEGRAKVDVASLAAGGKHVHEMTVEARRSGEFELTSVNFSYRDQYGVRVDGSELRWKLRATENGAPTRRSTPRPEPVLAVRLENSADKLALGSWRELRILVRNTSDVAINNVGVEVSGSLRTTGRRVGRAQLDPRTTARFPFDVIADEDGEVPITVRTTFTYPDGVGSIRPATHDDVLHVVVDRSTPPTSASGANGTNRTNRVVLYLTASPKDPDGKLPALRTDLEMREVQERLQLSRQRDATLLQARLAVRLKDVNQALEDYDPQVVHFSGHGDQEGNLLLEDNAGGLAPMTPEGLARLFGVYRSTIKCVIVNACYSERLAEAMADNITHVVGMRSPIGDKAAIAFSEGFYLGLFNGRPVPDAFELGLAHIQGPKATQPQYQVPKLFGPR
jgi:CHAT domain/Translocon-associated protein beta (TRAPB)